MISKIIDLPHVKSVNIERCYHGGFDITVQIIGGGCVSVNNSNAANGLQKAYELSLKNHPRF